MGRKKKHDEHENLERWLVSYADFITLLFAFFVVMYSISSINEGKYRVLSDALVAAFHAPIKTLQPIQVGRVAKSPYKTPMASSPSVIVLPELPQPDPFMKTVAPRTPSPSPNGAAAKTGASAHEIDAALRHMADNIKRAMAPLIKKDLIKVRQRKLWLEVEINTNILFPSGSATLAPDALPVLQEIAGILKPFPNPIHVEGFTDDVPIHTVEFPSNWELSATRAASVVHLFTRLGVDPRRMAAIGFGRYRPVANNATAQGRRKNRRVLLVILAHPADRRMTDVDQVGQPDENTDQGGAVQVRQMPAAQPGAARGGADQGARVTLPVIAAPIPSPIRLFNPFYLGGSSATTPTPGEK